MAVVVFMHIHYVLKKGYMRMELQSFNVLLRSIARKNLEIFLI